jgi:type I restriction enzyme S subunit
MKVPVIFDSVDHITKSAIRESATNLIEAGSVLFVTRSGILAHTLPVARTAVPVTVNQDIKAITPASSLEPDYVAWAARAYGSAILRQCSKDGTTVASVDSSGLYNFRLPIAPEPEQGRVVESIESYFTRLDDAVAKLERVERNLKRYRAAVLKAAVEGRLVPTEAELARAEGRDYEPAPVLLERILAERRRRWEEAELTKMRAKGKTPKNEKWKAKYKEPIAPDATDLPALPEGWCWASVDQLGDVSGGITQNAKREELPLQVQFLRVANVYANELRLDDVKTIGISQSELSRALLAPGDLLIVEGNGSIEQIGRVSLWDGSIDPCLHQNHIIKVRFSFDGLPRWTLSWLLAPAGRIAVERAASSTSGLHTLSLSKVSRLPVPLAPVAEQLRATAEADRFTTLALAAERGITANAQRCARLRQSILKWAFEGRLVDQDPADEPAARLLERIRAERENTNDKAPRSPRRAKARSPRS